MHVLAGYMNQKSKPAFFDMSLGLWQFPIKIKLTEVLNGS